MLKELEPEGSGFQHGNSDNNSWRARLAGCFVSGAEPEALGMLVFCVDGVFLTGHPFSTAGG